ncbi:MAG: DUF5056 domain-containing protein [Bacteroidales bacterium]|nr:DUF5056 domain-containing protein [Bacteroidales bacterium]
MSTISDKEIRNFFDKAKKEQIPDNGFSKRVMKQIPRQERNTHSVIVWGFGLVGLAIAVLSGAFFRVLGSLALFGRDLALARVPDLSPMIVYSVILVSLVSFSINIFRKSGA